MTAIYLKHTVIFIVFDCELALTDTMMWVQTFVITDEVFSTSGLIIINH